MKPGECWYINANYTHAVKNKGGNDRVHLVIDGERNEWTDELFFSMASPTGLLQNKGHEFDLKTMKQIYLELKSIHASSQVIKDW